MNLFDWLTLVGGLALFLFGMNFMSDMLKKTAGRKLKTVLGNIASKPAKGFWLGLLVTAIIQSSSATTVMIVGFVNSGTMQLGQAISTIMGANVGTAVTSWITALSGIGEGGKAVGTILNFLKPSTFTPVVAIIGVFMYMFSKSDKKKNLGMIMLGFAVLMTGMQTMSSAVEPLRESEAFRSILLMFENPILGVLAGMVLTAVIQSSSASVGILQSLTVTGAITFGNAVPIILGQNIGTCVTALLSSVGTNKNAKRAALVHLYFNVFGSGICLVLFYILKNVFRLSIFDGGIDMWGIAAVHTLFNIISVVILAPMSRLLEKLVLVSVRDKESEDKKTYLDERLLATPSVAVQRSREAVAAMADISCEAFDLSAELLSGYDEKKAQTIRTLEDDADKYEDSVGSYLVKLSGHAGLEEENRVINMLLHLIGDFERISDHAVNITESAQEIADKNVRFSESASRELGVLSDAVKEIVRLSLEAFKNEDCDKAMLVEPLEQVIDNLRDEIKSRHIDRLQKNMCTIEMGFILSDLLTNFERVADHCSNIAGCIIEISKYKTLEVHSFLNDFKSKDAAFAENYDNYSAKYHL
ncbi:MAG: Na/Pi cotransporter family protein [Eubacteriales bacterium]